MTGAFVVLVLTMAIKSYLYKKFTALYANSYSTDKK
jgi:hypothetical protein